MRSKLPRAARSTPRSSALSEPGVEVAESARGERALPRQRFRVAAQPLAVVVDDRLVDRREEAEVDVHRLEIPSPPPRHSESAGDVREERAMRSGERRQARASRLGPRRREARRHQPDGRRLRRSLRSR